MGMLVVVTVIMVMVVLMLMAMPNRRFGLYIGAAFRIERCIDLDQLCAEPA
jgi:hypothetical protein